MHYLKNIFNPVKKNSFIRILAIALVIITLMTTNVTAIENNYEQELIIETYTANNNWRLSPFSRTPNFVLVKHIEKYPEVPVYYQSIYNDIPYGEYGSIASHGCGVACLAMVATYLTDEEHTVIEMAEMFGEYNTRHGSKHILFKDSAEVLGLNLQEQTKDWNKVMEALRNGQVVIALQHKKSLFTKGGHFIVLTGITEDGRIMVNDPKLKNWTKNDEMIEGFTNGFTEEQMTLDGGPYWIYGKKVRVELRPQFDVAN